MTSTRKSRRAASVVASLALLSVSALVLGACTSPSATTTSAAATTSSTPTATATPTPVATYIAPLTGEVVSAPITTPALSSKIDNLADARPQYGLELTDLVFEELVEGGITRYVAVWNSQIPKKYGPVRSIRGMDPAIVSPLGGIITYSGGQQVFIDGIEATDVVNVSDDVYGGDSSLFYRTSAKVAPHNLLAKGQNIVEKFGDDLDPPAQQWDYAADAASSSAATEGTATKRIRATFSTYAAPLWTWDAASGTWLRFQTSGEEDVDSNGDQLSAVNVVTLRVTLKTISHTPVSQLVGTGKATISTGGYTVEGTYEKDSLTDSIHLYDAAGEPIELAPGNTWFELVATGGSVTIK
ncbi:MAG: DUF3048 domain-containing protein [Microbacteriaceae bacterium]